MKDYKSVWKRLAASQDNSALFTAQYCLIKAAKAKSNARDRVAEALLRRAFGPVTNANQLSNGREAWDTMSRMVRELHFSWNQTRLLNTPIEEILTTEEIGVYKSLIRILQLEPFAETEQEWTFIFVRQDLSSEYQAVQACHAAFKAGNKFDCKPDETYFCLVGVASLADLQDVQAHLSKNKTRYVSFVEPDLGYQLTAVTTAPMKAHKKRFLCHYPRLVFRNNR